ncbi:hypothetical protein COCOBI_08-0040 [Coccomyxa sp. Obi]|nr:hypothetical protein COCOBI_08-0040 [Coccomyxa sp. Obi]
MPKKLEKVPPAYPHLPEELWLRIASLLFTKEWVRASGTCKALQQLQVERINIRWTLGEASSATSGLLWLASHLQGAKIIVQVRDVDASNDGTYFFEILRKAINLSRLNIMCTGVPELPQMASLKHLSLRVEDTVLSTKQISEMMLGMPSLETLQLGRDPREPEREESALVVPAWVQHLELENVYPETLTLGSGSTRVALCSGALGALMSALERWSDVRGQVKGLRVRTIDIDGIDIDEVIHCSELCDNIEAFWALL